MPNLIARLSVDGLLVDDLAAQRVGREIFHGDRVVAVDVQEVVDADDVLVRDLAAVAQFVHEALHHLLVRGDVGVQELQDQPLLDHGVFHEQHRAERALADLLDELVAALDDVARLERRDVERGVGLRLVFLDDLRQLLIFDEQRLGGLLHLRRALVGGDLLGHEKRLSSSVMARATAWLIVPSPAEADCSR